MREGVRPAAVAGLFYDHRPPVLRADVRGHLDAARARTDRGGEFPEGAKAIIAPHAGHRYSGEIAAAAYLRLEPRREQLRRVVVIGPAHQVPLSGVAVSTMHAFATPLGDVPVDVATCRGLAALPAVVRDDAAHVDEHSIEVHLPYLQELLDDFELVPLLAGRATAAETGAVLDAVWGGPETAVVVSTDLSHYHDLATARRLDAATAAAILAYRPDDIAPHDACGAVPLRGLLDVATRRGLRCELLDLRTSGDTAGPPDRVVGYGAFALR